MSLPSKSAMFILSEAEIFHQLESQNIPLQIISYVR